MKTIKYLLVLLVAFLILPFAVFAEGEEEVTEGDASLISEQSKEVHVYLFRGEGCPHCQEAEEWFASIEEEYGNLFEVIDYETWYNSDNAALMKKVAEARGETAEGVPYIIIGNKSWAGFTEDYESEMIEQIKAEFEIDVDQRYDAIKGLDGGNQKKEKSTGSDVFALVLILAVVGAICFGVHKARSAVK